MPGCFLASRCRPCPTLEVYVKRAKSLSRKMCAEKLRFNLAATDNLNERTAAACSAQQRRCRGDLGSCRIKRTRHFCSPRHPAPRHAHARPFLNHYFILGHFLKRDHVEPEPYVGESCNLAAGRHTHTSRGRTGSGQTPCHSKPTVANLGSKYNPRLMFLLPTFAVYAVSWRVCTCTYIFYVPTTHRFIEP